MKLISYYIWKTTGISDGDTIMRWWNTENEYFQGRKPCEVPYDEIIAAIHAKAPLVLELKEDLTVDSKNEIISSEN